MAFEDLKRILFTTDIRDIGEAIVADIVDAIPIVGDISNFFKVRDAIKKKESAFLVALRIGDFLGGLIPGYGDVFDLITPTNTIAYILKKMRR